MNIGRAISQFAIFKPIKEDNQEYTKMEKDKEENEDESTVSGEEHAQPTQSSSIARKRRKPNMPFPSLMAKRVSKRRKRPRHPSEEAHRQEMKKKKAFVDKCYDPAHNPFLRSFYGWRSPPPRVPMPEKDDEEQERRRRRNAPKMLSFSQENSEGSFVNGSLMTLDLSHGGRTAVTPSIFDLAAASLDDGENDSFWEDLCALLRPHRTTATKTISEKEGIIAVADSESVENEVGDSFTSNHPSSPFTPLRSPPTKKKSPQRPSKKPARKPARKPAKTSPEETPEELDKSKPPDEAIRHCANILPRIIGLCKAANPRDPATRTELQEYIQTLSRAPSPEGLSRMPEETLERILECLAENIITMTKSMALNLESVMATPRWTMRNRGEISGK